MSKWGIIGLGYISPRHIAAIEEIGDQLVAACDIDPAKAITGVSFTTDWRQMIDTADIDWVAICTPNYLHYEMARYAESRGKKVLCEKPISLKSEEAKSLKNTYAVMQLRFHPVLEEISLNEYAENIGHLIASVERNNHYWEGWKGDPEKSGGILYNIGVHYFDLIRLLFGDEYEIDEAVEEKNRATGYIYFPNKKNWKSKVAYEIAVVTKNSRRKLVINGIEYLLSHKENLSEENLHTTLYRETKNGNGIKASEAAKSIELIEAIKKCQN